MLPDGVYLVNTGAALQERAVDRLLVRKRNAWRRQREQRRASSGNQAQDEIVGIEAAHHLQYALGCLPPGRVRDAVARLDHPNPPQKADTMTVAGDDEAAQGLVYGPTQLDRTRHRGGRLACADDHRAA